MKKSMTKAVELSDNPRMTAFKVLEDSFKNGRPPEDSLKVMGALLNPKNQGLAAALVYETLRHQSYLDWLLESRLKGRASLTLRLILRLGLAQILYFDRLGDHAIVMETVNLAKNLIPGREGVVNAILRGFLRAREAEESWPPTPPATNDPVADLALKHSYPEWLVRLIIGQLGTSEGEELLAAGNKPTPPTLRINPLKTSREDLAASLPFPTRPTEWSPWGLEALEFSGRPENWPGFAEGLFSVQDEASQLAGLLAVASGPYHNILDACAGLGGKSLLLSTLLPDAELTALDKDSAKLVLLKKEAARLGTTGRLKIVAADLLNHSLEPNSYDLVLVDAPCSGLGVIRRRPDLKWNKNPLDLKRLAKRQEQLLSKAATIVSPGGKLLYGVCTFSLEEGPGVVGDFLAAHREFSPLAVEQWPSALREHLSGPGWLRLWPHRASIDGFFWAMLVKSE